MFKNIFDISSRTRLKILKRMKLSCSNCGWSDSFCDLHHIVPRKLGGTDNHNNLAVLCPNCHRLAHSNKLCNFITLEQQVGDFWLDYYAQSNIKSIEIAKKGNIASLAARRSKAKRKADELLLKIKSLTDIDFTKKGWTILVADKLNLPRQKVTRFLREKDREFYNTCYRGPNTI